MRKGPEFIDAIQKIIPTDEHLQNVEHTLTLGAKRDSITIYTCIMLMYDVSSDGIIMVVSTLGYTSYQAGNIIWSVIRIHENWHSRRML